MVCFGWPLTCGVAAGVRWARRGRDVDRRVDDDETVDNDGNSQLRVIMSLLLSDGSHSSTTYENRPDLKSREY